MKQKQIKINYVIGGELQGEITISNNFVTRAYEFYKDIKIEDKQLLTSIIKVMLSEENGLDELKNGIDFEGKKYFPLITSPSMQKKEKKIGEINYKLEYLFIEEDDKEFKDVLERLLSGNKISQFKDEAKPICLVKDISARLGLATTGTYRINYKPYTVIVNEGKYDYKGKYSYYNDENKIEKGELNRSYVLNDGGGLMSNKCASEIAFNMGVNYTVDFAIIRAYKGIATKGVTVRFDFARYFKENYKADYGNNEESKFGFRLNDGVYEIKDIFGKWHNVDKIDLLLNKSQTKWAKHWSSMEELEKEYEDEFYNDYRTILDCFYVSKINKDPSRLKTHTKINYQVIQNTCLTDEDLIGLATSDINYYKRLLNFQDIDAVRLFLGDLVHEEIDKEDFGEECEEIDKEDYKEVATISDRLNFMLKKQEKSALKLKWVKRQIARMITKKIEQLSGGKINLKGGYKICALDPITYCNFLLTENTGDNGLNKYEFYIAGQSGKRVMYRNPIAMYQEIQKIELSNKLDNYLKNYTTELIFFNGKDDTLFQLSTADLDGDGVGVIENEVLYDCVVDEEYPFINKNDGADGELHIFTEDNLYQDILISSGNLIGQIALNNSKLNMICRSVDNFVIDDKEVYTYKMLREKFCEDKNNKLQEEFGEELTEEQKWNIEELTEEQKKVIKESIGELIKADNVKKLYDYNNRSKRVAIRKLFKAHKETYSNILLASQLSIDMPKTLKPVPEELMDKFAWLQWVGKPVFMHYLGKCSCRGKDSVNKCEDLIHWKKWDDFKKLKENGQLKYKDQSNVKKENNMMDIFNMYIVKELYIPAKKIKNGRESIEDIIGIIDFKCKKTEINLDFKSIVDTYKKDRNKHLGNTEELNLVDLRTFREIDKLNLNDSEIVTNIKNFKKVIDVRFLLMFCWDTYRRKVEEQGICDAYSYEKIEGGEIDWMYETYKRKKMEGFQERDIAKDSYTNLLKKTDNLIVLRVGGLTTTDIKGNEITIETGEFIDKKGNTQKQVRVMSDGNMIGYIFNDKADLVKEDVGYKINDIKPDKNNRNATVELEVI